MTTAAAIAATYPAQPTDVACAAQATAVVGLPTASVQYTHTLRNSVTNRDVRMLGLSVVEGMLLQLVELRLVRQCEALRGAHTVATTTRSNAFGTTRSRSGAPGWHYSMADERPTR